jgi:F-type H+-transporting ATPase subunit b
MAGWITAAELAEHIRGTAPFAAETPVDFDLSLLVMVALFLTLMILFNRALYRPYLRARAVRDDRIDGAKKDARQMQRRAERVFAEYEDKLSGALREASAERARVREEAKREEGRIVAGARAEMDAVLKSTQADLDVEMARVEADLERQARELAQAIVQQVLA